MAADFMASVWGQTSFYAKPLGASVSQHFMPEAFFRPKHVQANAGKPEFSSFPAFAAANENILMVSQY